MRLIHSLHDGYLDGLRLLANGGLRLFCRDVTKQEWTITVPALDRLRAGDFLEGNIIGGLYTYAGDEIPERKIGDLLQPSQVQPERQIREYLERMHRKQWTLLELDSSYGCELLAV